MKKINLTKTELFELLRSCFETVAKTLKENRLTENTVKVGCSISTNKKAEGEERPLIGFTPLAYLRMNALVDTFSTEIGWYGLVDVIAPNHYLVYDVKVCKQYVSGAKVDTDDDDMIDFFTNLSDEEHSHMHFQAHSHVNFGTDPSGIDMTNQLDVIDNMKGKGFYIFQIWNKKGEINTFLYDLDNNVRYDSDDIDMYVQDEKYGSIEGFVDSIKELVVEKKYPPYQPVVYSSGYTYGRPYTVETPKKETTIETTPKKNSKTNEKNKAEEDKFASWDQKRANDNRFGRGLGSSIDYDGYAGDGFPVT